MSVERSGTALPPVDDVAGERRSKQRFVARRRGEPCFWLVLDGQRIALNDLSAEGFSYPSLTPRANAEVFDFVLQREGLPDEIRGRAETVSYLADAAQTGCHFLGIEGDGCMFGRRHGASSTGYFDGLSLAAAFQKVLRRFCTILA